jgi:hypothetical protein
MAIIKKLAIHIFKLYDLKNLYLAERVKQRDADEKEFKDKLDSVREEYDYKMQQMQQTHESELIMCSRELQRYKQNEREITKREYILKIKNKENISLATYLYNRIFNIANILAKEACEISGDLELAQNNTIKQIKEK